MNSAAQQLMAEGEAVGYGRGQAEGYGRGRADGLTHLLQHRFNGALTPEIERRVAGASMKEIDAWLVRVLEAPTLDAVFKK